MLLRSGTDKFKGEPEDSSERRDVYIYLQFYTHYIAALKTIKVFNNIFLIEDGVSFSHFIVFGSYGLTDIKSTFFQIIMAWHQTDDKSLPEHWWPKLS